MSIQLNQVITKHLSDLVHVTTTQSLSFSSLFAILVVGRHVNEPKCKTVELKKQNKTRGLSRSRVILFFILINLFFFSFCFFFSCFVLLSFGHVTGRFPFVYAVFLLNIFVCVFLRWHVVVEREKIFSRKIKVVPFSSPLDRSTSSNRRAYLCVFGIREQRSRVKAQ